MPFRTGYGLRADDIVRQKLAEINDAGGRYTSGYLIDRNSGDPDDPEPC